MEITIKFKRSNHYSHISHQSTAVDINSLTHTQIHKYKFSVHSIISILLFYIFAATAVIIVVHIFNRETDEHKNKSKEKFKLN